VIVPAGNTVVENEFPRLVPDGVSVHVARLPRIALPSHADELLAQSESADLERCAVTLRDADVDVVLYACTSGSLLGGLDYPARLEARIHVATGLPAVVTIRAVVDLLRHLNWRRLAAVTPYEPLIHEATETFLKDSGFQVDALVGLEALPWRTTQKKGDLAPEVSYLLGREALRRAPKVDGLFISCANFRTLESIGWLRRDCRIPVVSSNLASAWLSLREAGLEPSSSFIEIGRDQQGRWFETAPRS
jgi:maleate isomerase